MYNQIIIDCFWSSLVASEAVTAYVGVTDLNACYHVIPRGFSTLLLVWTFTWFLHRSVNYALIVKRW